MWHACGASISDLQVCLRRAHRGVCALKLVHLHHNSPHVYAVGQEPRWHHRGCRVACHAPAATLLLQKNSSSWVTVSSSSSRLIQIQLPRTTRCSAMPAAASPDADTNAASRYWQLPEDVRVCLIDSAADLASVQCDLLSGGALSDTNAVGIDAEWAPGATTPSAALLQLALRSSATGNCTALVLVGSCSSQQSCGCNGLMGRLAGEATR